jgi:hypothetical protein
MVADGADDLQPVAAHERLAADERDLAGAQRRQLAHHAQRLLRRQLVGARLARSRAAVMALEVARERDLPYHVHGHQAAHVGFGDVAVRRAALGHRPLRRA